MSSRLPSTRPTTRRERIKRNEAIKHKDDIFLDKNSPTKFEFDSGVAEYLTTCWNVAFPFIANAKI